MKKNKKRSLFRKKKVKVIVVTLFTVACAAAIWGFIAFNSSAPQIPKDVQEIKVGSVGEYGALVLIADQKGFFTEKGLKATIATYPSGPAALADLEAGKIDVATASDFAGVRDMADGKDLKILATVSKSEAFFLIGRKDHGVSNTESLKGKKIGITRKTVGEFYVGQFLTLNKIGLGEVTLVDKPQNELVEEVATGRVDAAVLFEPNAYNARTRLGNDNAVRLSVQAGQSIYSLLYSTSKLTSERPETVERFVRALVAAQDFVKKHDSEAREIVTRQLKYERPYVDAIWPQFQFALSLEQGLLLNMDDEARWAIENGVIKTKTISNSLHAIYFDALEAVKSESITIIH